MKRQKILITGGSGLVGSYFCKLDRLRNYDIHTVDHTLTAAITGKSFTADLADPTSFGEILRTIQPDVIVNLAAMTNVDGCEDQRDIADKINHLAVKEIATYLENREGFAVHVSTDYVFDGERGDYGEEDGTNPLGWYGMTKLLGEQELTNCKSKNWCIARTSTPFGIHNKKESFPVFVIKSLSERREVKTLEDQITSPTYAGNLAEMLLEIADKRIKGVIHTAASTRSSRYDQALEIATVFGLDKSLIKPARMADMNWKAKRPKNSSLNVDKASGILSKKPIPFSKGLAIFASEYSQ